MKKLLFLIAMTAMTTATAQAQEVYNYLRGSVQNTISDPKSTDAARQVAQFKLDALNYMAMKMQEQMPDSSIAMLDRQAYALNLFVSYYMKQMVEMSKQPDVLQMKMTRKFMDASYCHPLFNDRDKELVLSYFNNSKMLTRFSLDTNWEAALAVIYREVNGEE